MTGINEMSDDICSTILEFLENNLSKKKHPRDDYRELLELTMIFLGGIPKKGILLCIERAVSHARWMAKVIYVFKIYLFQDQFQGPDYEKYLQPCISLFTL